MAEKPIMRMFKTTDFDPIDYSRNVRENHAPTALKEAIRNAGGLLEPPLVEVLPDKKIIILRGYLRITSMLSLKAEEPNDVRWQHINCRVMTGLTEEERVYLIADHGNVTPLTRVEVFFTAEKMFNSGDTFTEKDVAIGLETLLDLHYPTKRKLKKVSEDGGEELAAYRRGIIQQFHNGAKLPVVARNEYVKQLRGDQSWPNKKDVKDLLELFSKAKLADPTYSITRENPGAEWLKAFEEYKEKHIAHDDGVGEAPKQLGIMPSKTLEMWLNSSKNPYLKKVMAIILRTDKDSDKHLEVADAIFDKYMNSKTVSAEDQKKYFNV